MLAIARNECTVLNEWLAHYQQEGVSHFHIIDHGLNQECSAPRPNVTWYSWGLKASTGRSNQAEAYSSVINRIHSDWIAIFDLDEFAFGVHHSLAAVLTSLPHHIAQFCMPWITYGSSGHESQPPCVTASCIHRAAWPSEALAKCITRRQDLLMPGIHRSLLLHETGWNRTRGKTACMCADRSPCDTHRRLTGPERIKAQAKLRPFWLSGWPPSQPCDQLSARSIRRQEVRLHHYAAQSLSNMRRKSANADADVPNQKRDHWYWRRMERISNTIVDTTLSRRSVCRNTDARGTDAKPYIGYVGANALHGDHAPQWSDET